MFIICIMMRLCYMPPCYSKIFTNINSTGLNPSGNTVYATPVTQGGGATTTIVIVPAFGSAQVIFQLNSGSFLSGEVSVTMNPFDFE